MATRIVSSTVTGYTIRPGCAAERLHQADVVFSLHGDVGHGGHDAERGEDQDDHDGSTEQAADAVVDFAFGLGELADSVDVGVGEFLLEDGDVVLNFCGRARDTDLDQADPAWETGETLSGDERDGDSIIFGSTGRCDRGESASLFFKMIRNPQFFLQLEMQLFGNSRSGFTVCRGGTDNHNLQEVFR